MHKKPFPNDMANMTNKYEKVTVTLPVEIFDVIEKKRGLISRSAYVNHILKKFLRKRKTK